MIFCLVGGVLFEATCSPVNWLVGKNCVQTGGGHYHFGPLEGS